MYFGINTREEDSVWNGRSVTMKGLNGYIILPWRLGMWCERQVSNEKERIKDLIVYFEGTCEFCLANMGIEQYMKEIEELLSQKEQFDGETQMLLNYLYAVVNYKIENFEQAFKHWKEAEYFAEKIDDKKYIAKIYSYLAIYYYVKKEMNLVSIYFSQAEETFEKMEGYTELALHYINILWYKRYEENKKEVVEYLDKAIYYVNKSDSKYDARVFLHLGYIYKTIFADFVHGVQYLETASEMCYRNGNAEMECMTLHIIADGYLHLKYYAQALNIYEHIFMINEKKKITYNLQCMILPNMIYCFLCQKRYDRVRDEIVHFERVVVFADYQIQQQAYCILNLLRGKYYFYCEKNYEKALEYFNKSREEFYELNQKVYLDEFFLHLSYAFAEYYKVKNEMYKALQIMNSLEPQIKSYGKTTQLILYKNIVSILSQNGKVDECTKYIEKIDKLQQEIDSVDLVSQYNNFFNSVCKMEK